MAQRRAVSGRLAIKLGLYVLKRNVRRQNGMSMEIEARSLSRLSLTLDSIFIFSFHLITDARIEGKMLTIVFKSIITAITDMSARALNMLISSFCLISHVFKKGYDPVAEIALDGDFSVLGTAADSALDLERAS